MSAQLVLLSLWKQLYSVFCVSGWAVENNPGDVMVMSSELSQFGIGDYKFITETLYYKQDVWSFKDTGIYQAGRIVTQTLVASWHV